MYGQSDITAGIYIGSRLFAGTYTIRKTQQCVRSRIAALAIGIGKLDVNSLSLCTRQQGGAGNTKTVQTLSNMTCGKFRSDWITNPAPNSAVQYLGINWPLIRFSDVLLMFAEADNELNNGPSPAAIAAFEEVRQRGFAGNEDKMGVTPTSKEAFFNAIVNERSFELGGEGIRKYDLICWNLIHQKILNTREALTRMSNREAPYDNLPQSMFYQSKSSLVVWSSSLYQPAPASGPSGFTKVTWVSSITPVYITNVTQLFQPIIVSCCRYHRQR
jgi:SusD family.